MNLKKGYSLLWDPKHGGLPWTGRWYHFLHIPPGSIKKSGFTGHAEESLKSKLVSKKILPDFGNYQDSPVRVVSTKTSRVPLDIWKGKVAVRRLEVDPRAWYISTQDGDTYGPYRSQRAAEGVLSEISELDMGFEGQVDTGQEVLDSILPHARGKSIVTPASELQGQIRHLYGPVASFDRALQGMESSSEDFDVVLARFEEGKSVDVPAYLRDKGNEDAAKKWEEEHEKNKDKFKVASHVEARSTTMWHNVDYLAEMDWNHLPGQNHWGVWQGKSQWSGLGTIYIDGMDLAFADQEMYVNIYHDPKLNRSRGSMPSGVAQEVAKMLRVRRASELDQDLRSLTAIDRKKKSSPEAPRSLTANRLYRANTKDAAEVIFRGFVKHLGKDRVFDILTVASPANQKALRELQNYIVYALNDLSADVRNGDSARLSQFLRGPGRFTKGMTAPFLPEEAAQWVWDQNDRVKWTIARDVLVEWTQQHGGQFDRSRSVYGSDKQADSAVPSPDENGKVADVPCPDEEGKMASQRVNLWAAVNTSAQVTALLGADDRPAASKLSFWEKKGFRPTEVVALKGVPIDTAVVLKDWNTPAAQASAAGGFKNVFEAWHIARMYAPNEVRQRIAAEPPKGVTHEQWLKGLENGIADVERQIQTAKKKLKDMKHLSSGLSKAVQDAWMKGDREYLADREDLLKQLKAERNEAKKTPTSAGNGFTVTDPRGRTYHYDSRDMKENYGPDHQVTKNTKKLKPGQSWKAEDGWTFKKKAAGGLYGFTKKVQADCESCSRKVGKAAARIARALYAKNPKSAEFLSMHAKRGKSLSAKVLVQAMSEMGPKVARDARLAELRAGKAAAEDRSAGSYGLYGYTDKVSRLSLSACSDLRHEAGRIASDLHRRRSEKHAHISEFLKTHCKESKCLHSKLLLASYPDASMKLASDWIVWED